jgi:hypothetical protein
VKQSTALARTAGLSAWSPTRRKWTAIEIFTAIEIPNAQKARVPRGSSAPPSILVTEALMISKPTMQVKTATMKAAMGSAR